MGRALGSSIEIGTGRAPRCRRDDHLRTKFWSHGGLANNTNRGESSMIEQSGISYTKVDKSYFEARGLRRYAGV